MNALVVGTGGVGAARSIQWSHSLNPVVALELLANGTRSGIGLRGLEAIPAQPFLELLAE